MDPIRFFATAGQGDPRLWGRGTPGTGDCRPLVPGVHPRLDDRSAPHLRDRAIHGWRWHLERDRESSAAFRRRRNLLWKYLQRGWHGGDGNPAVEFSRGLRQNRSRVRVTRPYRGKTETGRPAPLHGVRGRRPQCLGVGFHRASAGEVGILSAPWLTPRRERAPVAVRFLGRLLHPGAPRG